ncbi:hypothetical protein BC628DRAFT_1362644 [Trametes gibbosa]|nr:hypothetical protein BC628DRAFT_1362644 [Trametes gibbosa]
MNFLFGRPLLALISLTPTALDEHWMATFRSFMCHSDATELHPLRFTRCMVSAVIRVQALRPRASTQWHDDTPRYGLTHSQMEYWLVAPRT